MLVALALTQPVSAETRDIAPGPGFLQQAIDTAEPGDTLRLMANQSYTGPVTIDRPLTLIGNGASLVGPGEGSVLLVAADDVTIRGLRVSGAGGLLQNLDSGIVLEKGFRRILIEDSHLDGNLIGIDVQGARDVTIRGNLIEGRNDLRVPERGPGIYVWNAPGLLVEGNTIRRGRDGIYISTSGDAVYRDNEMSDLRFAFHAMSANGITVSDNRSHDNDLGFAFMYSTDLTITGNLSQNDATHAYFMNFANHATMTGNVVREGGEKCLFIYNSNHNRYEANSFEGCDIGVHYTAGSSDNVLTRNSFIGNRTQAKYVGSRWLEWSENGIGNFWSDNAGFDVDGDGISDSAYRPNNFMDQVIWSQPMAKLLLGAPATQLVIWSQSHFPGLLPGGVTDSHPLTAPVAVGSEDLMQ